MRVTVMESCRIGGRFYKAGSVVNLKYMALSRRKKRSLIETGKVSETGTPAPQKALQLFDEPVNRVKVKATDAETAATEDPTSPEEGGE